MTARIPRPLGFTMSQQAYHRTDDDKQKQEINHQSKILLIRHYIANNYTINGKYYDTLKLSNLLKVSTRSIQTLIYQYTKELFQLNKLNPLSSVPSSSPHKKQEPLHNNLSNTIENNTNITIAEQANTNHNSFSHNQAPNSVSHHITQSEQDITNHEEDNNWQNIISEIAGIGIGSLFSASLSDRALIMEQAMLLKSSQGGSYKAFISGEYGKTLDLLLKSQGSFKDLIDLTKGNQVSQTIQILNGDLGNKDEDKAALKAFTADQAIALIATSKIPITLGNHSAIEALNQAYSLDDLPTVNAMEQGTESSVPKLITPVTKDEAEGIGQGLKAEGHQDRRAHQEGVDLDADHME